MKKTILIIIFFLILGPISYGEDSNNFILDEQINILNLDNLEELINDTVSELDLDTEVNIKDFLLSLVKGESKFDLKEIGKKFRSYFFYELKLSLSLLGKILIIALVSAILTNLQSAFENGSISNLANYISYTLIAILSLASFNQIVKLAGMTIDKMTKFMEGILPVLLTLLTITSGVNTKLLFNPIMVIMINLIGLIIKNTIIPLIYISFIITVISNITNRLEFGKLSEMIRQLIIIMISAFFTIFIGIITIYGMGTKIDGITIRTAKFAIDNFIPIVGGFLSDAVEAVVGYSAILKNGIGFIGLITLLFICLIPIIKIFALFFVYKLTAVLVQPIVSNNLISLFDEISKSLLLILISIISTATMFFITITIMVETGNNLLMLR